MTREARHLRCPESVLGWIPWYVEGSLTPRQRGAVESHAAECADCRAEIDMIAGAPFEIDVDLPDPERAFEALSARIAAEGTGSSEAAPTSGFSVDEEDLLEDRRADWAAVAEWTFDEESGREVDEAEHGRVIQGPWMRSNLWAAAAALILISAGALLGSVVPGLRAPTTTEPTYETASAPSASLALSESGPRIDIVFQPTATAAEISSALRDVGVEVVAGPTQLGVYRVRLVPTDAGARGASRVDAEAAVAQLKAAPGAIVIFAERVH